jgi:hypothetical protein
MVSFDLWIPAVTKPKETFASAKKKADWGDAIIQLVIAGIIAGLIGGFVGGASLAGFLGSQPGTTVTGAGTAVLGGIGAIIGAIVTPIIYVVSLLVGCFILNLLVNAIFKGKGELKQLYYVVSLYYAPLAILSAVLSAIPVIGLATILVSLYELYLLYLAVKEVNQV